MCEEKSNKNEAGGFMKGDSEGASSHFAPSALENKKPQTIVESDQEPVEIDIQRPRTYRDVNLEKKHSIPIGALVELETGARLFVLRHVRDCDGTPLYTLDTCKRFLSALAHRGYPEESLTEIKQNKSEINSTDEVSQMNEITFLVSLILAKESEFLKKNATHVTGHYWLYEGDLEPLIDSSPGNEFLGTAALPSLGGLSQAELMELVKINFGGKLDFLTANEDLKYQLQTLASYSKDDLESHEIEVYYEDMNGSEGSSDVDLIDLGGRALKRIQDLESELSKLKAATKSVTLIN